MTAKTNFWTGPSALTVFGICIGVCVSALKITKLYLESLENYKDFFSRPRLNTQDQDQTTLCFETKTKSCDSVFLSLET